MALPCTFVLWPRLAVAVALAVSAIAIALPAARARLGSKWGALHAPPKGPRRAGALADPDLREEPQRSVALASM